MIMTRQRNRHIDRDIAGVVGFINSYTGYETLGSCFGHGRYPTTVVVRDMDGTVFELFSRLVIPRKRNFYRRDGDGYYFIPEVSEEVR